MIIVDHHITHRNVERFVSDTMLGNVLLDHIANLTTDVVFVESTDMEPIIVEKFQISMIGEVLEITQIMIGETNVISMTSKIITKVEAVQQR